jgi:hypothetical protein
VVPAFGAQDDEPERVALGDYPDESVVSQLREKVVVNRGRSGVNGVIGHVWGIEDELAKGEKFDIIMARTYYG